MIDFEDFEAESITVELRYPATYSLWDEAGNIWTRISSVYPELKLNAAVANQQVFESSQVKAMVELEAFRVISRGPKAEVRAAEMAQHMLEVCTKYMRLSLINRVGFREIRTRRFPTIGEAVAAVEPLMTSRLVEGIGDSAKIVSSIASVRHETETFGLQTSLRAEEREFKASFPWELSHRLNPELSKQLGKEPVVIIDSDYYTVGTAERDSLSLLEWSKQAERSIRKYWRAIQ